MRFRSLRQPRFDRTSVATDTNRTSLLRDYILRTDESGNGFVCSIGRAALAAHQDNSDVSRVLIIALPHEFCRQLDCIYTAIFSFLTKTCDAIVFVEPTDPAQQVYSDTESPNGHLPSFELALEFYCKLYSSCEYSLHRGTSFHDIVQRAHGHARALRPARSFAEEYKRRAPTIAIGRLLLTTIAPSFSTTHPRYSPVMAHAVVPQTHFVRASKHSDLGRLIHLDTVLRVDIPYDTLHFYPIPGDFDFAEHTFREIVATLDCSAQATDMLRQRRISVFELAREIWIRILRNDALNVNALRDTVQLFLNESHIDNVAR